MRQGEIEKEGGGGGGERERERRKDEKESKKEEKKVVVEEEKRKKLVLYYANLSTTTLKYTSRPSLFFMKGHSFHHSIRSQIVYEVFVLSRMVSKTLTS